MALSGNQEFVVGDKGAAGIYRLRLSWSASQNRPTNQSTITYEVTVQSTSAQYNAYDLSSSGGIAKILLGGEEIDIFTGPFDCRNLQIATVLTGSYTINHLANGTFSQVLQVSFKANNLTSYTPDGIGSFILELDQIPRASSMSATPAKVSGECAILIRPASAAFRHTLTYLFGGTSGTIYSSIPGGILSWTIPNSFNGILGNQKYMYCDITCITYDQGIQVGDPATYRTMISANSQPVINSVLIKDTNPVTIALSGSDDIIINHASTMYMSMDGTPGEGATLPDSGYLFRVSGGSSSYVGNNLSIENAYLGEPVAGEVEIVCTLTDSRNDSSSYTKLQQVIDYFQIGLSDISATRSGQSDGYTTVSVSGRFWNEVFSTITGTQNEITAECRYSVSGSGTWSDWTDIALHTSGNSFDSEETILTLDYQLQFDIEVRVSDKVSSKVYPLSVPSGEPFLMARMHPTLPDGYPAQTRFNGRLYLNGWDYDDEVLRKYEMLDYIHPPGSVLITVDPNFDPNFVYNGTWVRFAQGRTLVGVDETQTEFNTSGKIGGEKAHTLTTQEMPSHTHNVLTNTAAPNIYSTTPSNTTGDLSSSDGRVVQIYWSVSGTHGPRNISSVGSGQAHNNLQPYITCYIWNRTA